MANEFIKKMREMAKASMEETNPTPESLKNFMEVDELGKKAEEEMDRLTKESEKLKKENQQLMELAKTQILKQEVSKQPKGEGGRTLAQITEDYLKNKK